MRGSMARFSNGLVGCLNAVALLISTAGLWMGIWLKHSGGTECMTLISNFMMITSVVLIVVSLMGLIGAFCDVTWLLWLYLFLMFFLIVGTLGWIFFSFIITNKGAGEILSHKGYKEYRLGDYAHWLQKRVNKEQNWIKIKSCLVDGKFCEIYNDKYSKMSVQDFYGQPLNPIESGCCKPSNDCGFEYVSPTNWTKGGTAAASTNPDCGVWSNDPKALCFDCQSCKAGFIDTIKRSWKKATIWNMISLIFLICVYCLGCCAFKNSKYKNRSGYYMWRSNP